MARDMTGITIIHSRRCTRPAVSDETKCPCGPTFQASAWIARARKRLRHNAPSVAAAKAWRIDQLAALQAGTLRAPTKMTLVAAADELITRMRGGAIRNRSGDRYKPSAIRNYEQGFRLRLTAALGPHKLSDIGRADLQRLVGEWQAAGLDPSTIRNTINAARVLCRHADELTGGAAAGDPTVGLRLPAVRGRRDRIASPEEAALLLDALQAEDRPVWSAAFFAGLRHGELRALRWENVDLAAGLISVEEGWDQYEGEIDPKSRSGRRRVPIIGRLRDALLEHKIATERATGLVFGRSETLPFSPNTVNDRARRAWGWKKAPNPEPDARPRKVWVKGRDDALDPIGLHECRHTFASLLIAAGVDLKAVSTYLGHASITITLDLYGHLLPGSEAGHGAQLEAFLDRADTATRLAQLDVA